MELRGRETLFASLVLAFLILLVSHLAWGNLTSHPELAPGVLWVAFVFAGTLGLGRSLHRERDRGTWEALALLPVDWGLIYLAKVATNLLLLLLLQAITIPAYGLLFDHNLLPYLPRLAPLFVLGALGLSAAGTLLAAASAYGHARELLLPVLLLPLLVPLLMMTLQATQKVLAGAPSSLLANETLLLVAFDAIFLAVGWLTFDYLLGE